MKKDGLDVLLIQNDVEGTEQIKRVLKGYYANVHIEVGSTWRECLGFLRQRNYDILLLGYRLLDCTSLDALGAVIVDEETPPVIVIVEPSEVWVALSAIKAGAFDYIVQTGEHLLTLPFVIQRTLNYYRSLKKVDQLKYDLRKAEQRLGVDQADTRPVRQDLGILDGSTQIYNQWYFELRLTEEFQRARRYAYPISLLVIDIDDLPLFRGTRKRDQILSDVARMVSQGVRQTDLVARRIETDFGMLLLYSDIEGGCGVAERIRHQIEESGLEENGRESVTISIGISSLSAKDDRPDMFVSFADRALHNAKVRGGNQVAVVQRN